MNFNLKDIESLLKRKDLFSLGIQLLNFVFVISISSSIFEKHYFNYSLIDFSNYKAIYSFFVHGDFAVPFSIFFIIWMATKYVSELLFIGINLSLSRRIRKRLYKVEMDILKEKKKIEESSELINGVSIKKQYGTDWIIYLIEAIKNQFSNEEYQKILVGIKKVKNAKEEEFVFLVRGLIAITIYICYIPYFGYLLYSILVITILVYVIFIVLLYQLMEITPDMINIAIKWYKKHKDGI